jgi:hypothetical protein
MIHTVVILARQSQPEPSLAQALEYELGEIQWRLTTSCSSLAKYGNRYRIRSYCKAIADFKIDGRSIDSARARNDLYVLKAPIERKWGGFLSRKTDINSSQLMQILLGVGSMQAAHAKMVAFFFGFLTDTFHIDERPANKPIQGDNNCVNAFKLFLAAAALAGTSNVPLLIDA